MPLLPQMSTLKSQTVSKVIPKMFRHIKLPQRKSVPYHQTITVRSVARMTVILASRGM